MKYSKDGYKRTSKDRNNPYNILDYKIYICDRKDKFIYLEDIYKQLVLLSN